MSARPHAPDPTRSDPRARPDAAGPLRPALTGGSVGLVLGAGGVVGQAYQAGVLAALFEVGGWDARAAAVIVGTSAGAVTGAALRVGVPGPDLAAALAGRPLSAEGGPLLRRILPDDGPLPTPSPTSLLRPWRLPPPALITRALRRPLAVRPGAAAVTMMPAGRLDVSARARGLDHHAGDRWPAGLRICAVRRSDGTRVVFGAAGAPAARLAPAVLASCAIPGYFAPVVISGTEYLDGGAHSATNADVLHADALDVVLVISSMSTRGGMDGPDVLVRRAVRHRLGREVDRLERAGTTVVRLEPGAAARRAMGWRTMSERSSPRVVAAAYEETAHRLSAEPNAVSPAVARV